MRYSKPIASEPNHIGGAFLYEKSDSAYICHVLSLEQNINGAWRYSIRWEHVRGAKIKAFETKDSYPRTNLDRWVRDEQLIPHKIELFGKELFTI